MLNCTILPNGALKLTAGNETRAYIKQRRADANYWTIMAELFESYACNGSFTHFDAGDGNPFIGLTSAPAIAESLSYEDDGKREIEGRAWYFRSYELVDDLDELQRFGRVIYSAVPQSS